MNILMIGNGFDLAHKLPTTYGDFLDYTNVLIEFLKLGNKDVFYKLNKDIVQAIISNASSNNVSILERKDMFDELIYNNDWIDYFNEIRNNIGENWIDFEKEIANVIKILDNESSSGIGGKISTTPIKYFNDKYLEINPWGIEKYINEIETYKELRDKLIDDLNRLIRFFEIYITEIISGIDTGLKLKDIELLEIDKVISFNYSDTYNKLYNSKAEIDFIHGKACRGNDLITNNMVLGIDEYLDEDEKDTSIDYIEFKKYYQRIYKSTGQKYKEWTDEIEEEYMFTISNLKTKYEKHQDIKKLFNLKKNQDSMHNLYIFGHSLDVTDKDIIKNLVLHDNVNTTIYYHNRETRGRLITNLVKVIGQDELMRRTGGSTQTIFFKEQCEPMKT